jgi:hypothetical protein
MIPAAPAQVAEEDEPVRSVPATKAPTLEFRAQQVFKAKDRLNWPSFSTDGTTLAATVWTATDPRCGGAIVCETRTGKLLAQLTWKDLDVKRIDRVCLSPDGKILACVTVPAGAPRYDIQLIDVTKGTTLRTLRGHMKLVQALSFSPDGKLIASASWAASDGLKLWDVTTGKDLKRFAEDLAADEIAFAPDGATLAVATPDALVHLLDVATGKELRLLRLPSRSRHSRHLAFSPDGRLLALGSWQENVIDLCDWRHGKRLQRLYWQESKLGLGTNSLIFTADGRSLVVAGDDKRVRVWEVASRQMRYHVEESVALLAVARTGTLFAGAMRSGDVCLWDARRCLPARPSNPLPKADEVWSGLADPEAADAFLLMRNLVTDPRQAIAILDKCLATVSPKDSPTPEQLVRDLDDDLFEVREKASRRLAEMGEAARPALVNALANKPSAEVKKQVQELLALLGRPTDPETLRLLRAVEVLEMIGTPEARRVLKRLTEGDGNALLTREARAALLRLNSDH